MRIETEDALKKKWLSKFLEVVLKPQIMFENPACWRDFASDTF